MRCSWPLFLAAVLAFLSTQGVRSQSPSEVDNLDNTCLTKLNLMFAMYTTPRNWTEACDPQCLINCNDVLQDAVYSTTSSGCPDQTNITTCFNVYAEQWEEYVSDCELFNFSEETAEADGTADGDAAAEAGAPVSELDQMLADGQSIGGLINSQAEGEGAPATVPADGAASEGAAAPPPPSEGGRRRLLDDDIEPEGEGEGAEAAGAGAGCFPTFKYYSDFATYISGQWWDTEYNKASDTAGIIMSVFFWIGLASVGVLVRN